MRAERESRTFLAGVALCTVLWAMPVHAVNQDTSCPPARDPECDPGAPVNLHSGNVWLSQTDIVMRGLGGSIQVFRGYNSKSAYDGDGGVFGRGWISNLDHRLHVMDRPDVMSLRTGSGQRIYYSDFDGDGIFRAEIPATETSWLELDSGGYTRRFIGGASESFDGHGRWIASRDPAGNTLTVQRDGAGRPLRMQEPGGRFVAFTLTGDHITSIAGPLGAIASYTYNGRGYLETVTYADESGYTFSYNDLAQLLELTDRTGRVLEKHEYQGEKGITSEVGNGQEAVRLTYDDSFTTVVDGRGHATIYEYQPIWGRTHITRASYPGGESEDWDYDDQGRLVWHKNRAGSTTRYEFDARGRLTTSTNEAGGKTVRTYDSADRVETITDAEGGVTRFTYGPFGPTRIEYRRDGAQRAAIIEYDARGLPFRETDPGGRVVTKTFGPSGDLLSLSSVAGSMSFTYDPMGRLLTVVDPAGAATTYAYDPRGRVREMTLADGSSSRVTYDRGGRLESTTDPLSRVTAYSYDQAGRLETVIDAAGHVTRMSYDVMSNLTSITDAEGRKTAYELDANNRIVKTTFPGGGVENIQYDSGGRPWKLTDRRGKTMTHSYDAAGRLVRKSYSDGSPSLSFAYDAMGRPVRATNGADSLQWTYDRFGRVQSETSRRHQSKITYTYDALNNRLAVGLDGRSLLGYTYDPLGRLVGINDGTAAFGFEYDAASRRTVARYPNGVVTRFQYDTVGRIVDLGTAAASPIVQFAHTYDAFGHRTSKTALDYAELYTFDSLSRLTSVQRPSTAEQNTWTYDRVGNRRYEQGTGLLRESTYDDDNQLLLRGGSSSVHVTGAVDEPAAVTVNGNPASAGGGRFDGRAMLGSDGRVDVVARDAAGNETARVYQVPPASGTDVFEYDASGNTVRRSSGSDEWLYEWDVENRLRRVIRNGGEVARFDYDPLGRRIEKVTGGVSRSYLYDGEAVLRETVTESAASRQMLHVHGVGVDRPLAVRDMETGATSFLHADALGSVVRVTNSAAQVVHGYRYDAWGKIEVGAERSGYAFTGREWDAETGLYYYRARYYDADVGRFLSQDPLGFGGGMNWYAYALGNPITNTDPFGRQSFGIGIEPPSPSAISASGAHDAYASPGHTFAYIKDDSGKVTSVFSYGPGASIVMNKSDFKDGNLPGRGDYHLEGPVLAYEWKITNEQKTACEKKIDDVKANPGNYTRDNNCTGAAVALAQSCGVPVPNGVGPVHIPAGFLFEGYSGDHPNPHALSQQLNATMKPKKTNADAFPDP